MSATDGPPATSDNRSPAKSVHGSSATLAEVQRALAGEVTSARGAGIYRKLVRRGLEGIFRFQLPRTAAHLGARWDREVARFFDETQPRSHYVREVAFELVAHVAPAWQSDPEIPRFMGDLARFELLGFEVANAPDDPPLQRTAPIELDRRVSLSLSMRVARFAFAVHLSPDEEANPSAAPAEVATALCVYRDAEHEIRRLVLTPSAAEILERLAAGDTLGDAVAGAASACALALDAPFLQGAARLLEDLSERQVVRGSM